MYAWLHKEGGALTFYNDEHIGIEEVKRQLLQDEDFLQQVKDNVCVENVVDEQKDKGLDWDEEMLMTGLAMFENDF